MSGHMPRRAAKTRPTCTTRPRGASDSPPARAGAKCSGTIGESGRIPSNGSTPMPRRAAATPLTLNDTPGSRDKVVITPKVAKFNGCGGRPATLRLSRASASMPRPKTTTSPRFTTTRRRRKRSPPTSARRFSRAAGKLSTCSASDVRVYSTPESGDQAVLHGNPREKQRLRDVARAGEDRQPRAEGSGPRVPAGEAHAGASGQDQVTFHGNPDKPDVFTASRQSARLSGKGYDLRAEGLPRRTLRTEAKATRRGSTPIPWRRSISRPIPRWESSVAGITNSTCATSRM